jgi:phage terminase small subunit
MARRPQPKKREPKRKRLTKELRAMAEAKRLAKLLAEAPPASPGALAPPALIADPRLAPAYQFWKDHADKLSALGTLEHIDRFMFALYSIYVADFVLAERDILDRGYSVMVKTISGDRMPRENPSVGRRDFAMKMIIQMSAAFGLTKVDRLSISKLVRGTDMEGTLFDTPQKPKSESDDPGEPHKWDKYLQ